MVVACRRRAVISFSHIEVRLIRVSLAVPMALVATPCVPCFASNMAIIEGGESALAPTQIAAGAAASSSPCLILAELLGVAGITVYVGRLSVTSSRANSSCDTSAALEACDA